MASEDRETVFVLDIQMSSFLLYDALFRWMVSEPCGLFLAAAWRPRERRVGGQGGGDWR